MTITDDDLPGVNINAAATEAAEGDALSFTVTRDGSTHADLIVTLDVSETGALVPRANEGAQTVTILAADTSATFTVQTDADDATWAEHSTVTVTVADNAVHDPGTPFEAETEVKDDDFPAATAVLSVAPNPVSEGGGPVTATITVTTARDEMPHGDSPATLSLSTASDTASSPSDYASLSESGIAFAASAFTRVDDGRGAMRWQATVEHEIAITADDVVEEEEQFRVHLSRSPDDTPITIDSSSTPKTVTVNDAPAISTDSSLRALSLSEGKALRFRAETTGYSLPVHNTVERATVSATVNDAAASAVINPADADGVTEGH